VTRAAVHASSSSSSSSSDAPPPPIAPHLVFQGSILSPLPHPPTLLICRLQAEPHEQLLLNSERQESLWQLLCITLAHMLLALNPPDDPEDRHPDRALIRRFYQQLQESGVRVC
jgi:hypothetical protein